MGIDVCFAKQVGEEWEQDGEEAERIASVGGLFALAEVLSHLMGPLRAWQDDFVTENLKPFWAFLKEDREDKTERFNHYCEFVNRANREFNEKAGEEGHALVGLPRHVDAGDFDADVQAFLGGFILCNEPIYPQTVDCVIPFIGFSLGLIKHYAGELKATQPEVAEAFEGAYASLDILRTFCDQALQQNRVLFIDC